MLVYKINEPHAPQPKFSAAKPRENITASEHNIILQNKRIYIIWNMQNSSQKLLKM